MPGESKSSPRRIQAAWRQAKALEMRIEGKSFKEIAEALDYRGPTSAHYAVTAALNRVPQENALQYRRLNVGRLNELLAAFWPSALRADHKSGATCLALIVEMNKLMGAYPPAKPDMGLVRQEAQRIAERTGMTVEQVIAEAEAIMAEAAE